MQNDLENNKKKKRRKKEKKKKRTKKEEKAYSRDYHILFTLHTVVCLHNY